MQTETNTPPEPLATILAEARKNLADSSWIDEITLPDEDGDPNDYARKVVPLEDALEAIDRIEAAAKRERAPGNTAAMREALSKIANRTSGCGLELHRDIYAWAWNALHAPARNCDRFQTADDAREAFQKARGHKVWADIELWDDMDEVGAFVRWLFAPAEGGDHA